MTKKKAEKNQLSAEKRIFDSIVVGAGPAGQMRASLCAQASESVLLLEASEILGGFAKSGFSLLDIDESQSYPILTGSMLDPLIVRWERQWVEAEQVDWQSKEWESTLPQWHAMAGRALSYFIDMTPPETTSIETQFRCPVVGLKKEDELWTVVTPEGEYQAKNIYWAAGITAFQNAIGKLESQRYLAQNPKYQMAAADYRGGIGIDWELSGIDAAKFTVAAYRFFALPVRFEGKYLLLFGALLANENGMVLRTFAHLHHDRLKDPKTLSAVQKSLRRGINSLFEEGAAPTTPKEKSYVHDRIMGHIEGTPWVLTARADTPNLHFIGEESLKAAESRTFDVAAALESVI
jgi:glycine/D-amino acid oxidase-like deaminating enzyme